MITMRDSIISDDIVEKWLKAWSLSRELPPPLRYKSGFMVNVGEEKQKIRYVFPELNDDFFQLSKAIEEPWIFLKVCVSPDELGYNLPQRWEIQPQGYMMPCFHLMNDLPLGLPINYKFELSNYNSTIVARVKSLTDELASEGRLIMVDDLAVYDRIFTNQNHRRKGLAAFLIKELEKIALTKGIFKNFLVATEEGKMLYESLGWEVNSFYTSVVITDLERFNIREY